MVQPSLCAGHQQEAKAADREPSATVMPEWPMNCEPRRLRGVTLRSSPPLPATILGRYILVEVDRSQTCECAPTASARPMGHRRQALGHAIRLASIRVRLPPMGMPSGPLDRRPGGRGAGTRPAREVGQAVASHRHDLGDVAIEVGLVVPHRPAPPRSGRQGPRYRAADAPCSRRQKRPGLATASSRGRPACRLHGCLAPARSARPPAAARPDRRNPLSRSSSCRPRANRHSPDFPAGRHFRDRDSHRHGSPGRASCWRPRLRPAERATGLGHCRPEGLRP